MVFNPFKKKDDFVDLSAHFRKQQELAKERAIAEKADGGDLKKSFYPGVGFSKKEETAQAPAEPAPTAFGVFNPAPTESSESNHSQNSFVGTSQDNASEKRKKLAKRLIDMTTKMEDLTNQLYSLQQRIEVLERKSGVGY
ncbi:hypothetical protein KAR91_49230 [Candidatus Pacearchaeota archaeon]|nr:hypothetical protein [Candidatus Pacearchaeota archaeon]